MRATFRTRRHRAGRAHGLILLPLAAALACEPEPSASDPPSLRPPPETTMIPVRPPPRLVARDSLPTRIFYDLTRFVWYARGEPLRWQDAEWQPRGEPVALRTEDLRLVGEYEGVDIWIRADAESVTRVYVPVSEGFWLPFAATGDAR